MEKRVVRVEENLEFGDCQQVTYFNMVPEIVNILRKIAQNSLAFFLLRSRPLTLTGFTK